MTNEEIGEILKQSEQAAVKRSYIDLITRVEVTTTMMKGLLVALEETGETISTDVVATALKRYIKQLEL